MRITRISGLILAVALVLAAPLFADRDHEKGKGNPHADVVSDEPGHHGDQASGRDRHQHKDGWERRSKYEYRVYGKHEGRPPGWKRGRKTSWANCGLPPGQAKKNGCWTYVHEGRTYYYYQDVDEHIVVRRPVVHIEGVVSIN